MGTTTMTRNDSYKEVAKTLGDRHILIVNHMLRHPGCSFTACELAIELYEAKLIKAPKRNQTHPRLNELVSMEKVAVSGIRKDNVTERNVSTYELFEHTI